MLTLLALYGGLFLTALVAATLLPAQSELLLATLLVQSGEPAWALITVATLGNSAGSAVNWWLGRYLTRFQDRSTGGWAVISPAFRIASGSPSRRSPCARPKAGTTVTAAGPCCAAGCLSSAIP